MERSDLLSLKFYEKSPFTGSVGNLRYRVEKAEIEIDGSERKEKKLLATIWPGPFAFANTDDALKTSEYFAFSEDGLNDIADWINANTSIYTNS